MHEACLIQWLLAKNIRQCELCHSEFDISEEYGTVWEIIQNSVSYLLSNYKRMFKFAIYSVYMYLFFKRFVYVARYFKDLVIACMRAYFRMLKAIFKTIFMAPTSKNDEGFFKSMSHIFSNLACTMTTKSKQ